MSNFTRYCAVARDPRQPIGKRYKSLRYAVERYSWLTRTSFGSVFYELETRWGLKVGIPNSGEVLTAAATDLENARLLFLIHLNALSIRRKSEKLAGRRFPSADWVTTLSSGVTLGSAR
jgi:hypothetical protein